MLYIRGSYLWALPVVKVVLQFAVANAKFEWLQELFVVQQVEAIEHVAFVVTRLQIHHERKTTASVSATRSTTQQLNAWCAP